MKLTEPCLVLDHVSKRFGQHAVLNDITLSIQPAEIFGLLGPSGSGKTTLVRLIAGIDTASSGTVNVLATKMPQLSMMQRIGYMSQSEALYADLTAHDNLTFFGNLFGLKGQRLTSRMNEVMDLVDLSSYIKRPVHLYSGGMKRRLSLAIALLHEPELLLLDEPTVGIDPILRRSIWNKLEQLSATGTTIVVTTHVMDEADKCHRLGMIRESKLIASGSPSELKQLSGTNTIEEAFLTFGGMKS